MAGKGAGKEIQGGASAARGDWSLIGGRERFAFKGGGRKDLERESLRGKIPTRESGRSLLRERKRRRALLSTLGGEARRNAFGEKKKGERGPSA